MHIQAEIRWLGGATLRARFQANRDGSSSVVAAVLSEAAFCRLYKGGARLLGRRYEVDTFEEAGRPDALCGRCSEWEDIAPHCLPTNPPRRALCARNHLTTDHQRPVEGRRVGKGYPCPHGAAKCANCGGAHGARADACAFKREARQSAKGWRPPLPPRRERRAAGAPKSPETEAPATQEGKKWVMWRSRRGKREGRLRLPWRQGNRRLGGPVVSFLFLFAFMSWYAVFFFCLAELREGDQRALLEPIIPVWEGIV